MKDRTTWLGSAWELHHYASLHCDECDREAVRLYVSHIGWDPLLYCCHCLMKAGEAHIASSGAEDFIDYDPYLLDEQGMEANPHDDDAYRIWLRLPR